MRVTVWIAAGAVETSVVVNVVPGRVVLRVFDTVTCSTDVEVTVPAGIVVVLTTVLGA